MDFALTKQTLIYYLQIPEMLLNKLGDGVRLQHLEGELLIQRLIWTSHTIS